MEQLAYQLAFQSKMAPELNCYEIIEDLGVCLFVFCYNGAGWPSYPRKVFVATQSGAELPV